MFTETDEQGLLPFDEVHTPALDEWADDGQFDAADGRVRWIDPDGEFHLSVDRVELSVVDQGQLVTAYEVGLRDIAGPDGGYEPGVVYVRETIRNSRIAVYVAEFVATHAEAFVDEWNEGVAPRPKDVDPTP